MPDITQNFSPTSFRISSTDGTNFNNRDSIIPDNSSYAESEQNATFIRYMYLYPAYSLNNILPSNVVIRQVRGYLEALKVSTTYAMNFSYSIRKTTSGTGGVILDWSEATSVPSSYGSKTFVYDQSSADYKPQRSDFNESFYIGYRWDGSGLLSSSLIRVRYHYITITWYIPAASVSLNKSQTTLEVGNTEQLISVILPDNSTDKLTWTSNNPSVAAVSGAGLVTAVSAGTTKIRATAESGVYAECAVTVTQTFNLQTSLTPEGAGSISPSSGNFTVNTARQIQVTPSRGFVISQILLNGATQTVTNPLGQQIGVTFTKNISIAVTFDYRQPIVTQYHTRERISDKPGYEKSVATYRSDMDYVECEIRRTAAGASRGHGIGQLLDSGTAAVGAGVETVFEIFYYLLTTDGDYTISVYVKSALGIWSG